MDGKFLSKIEDEEYLLIEKKTSCLRLKKRMILLKIKAEKGSTTKNFECVDYLLIEVHPPRSKGDYKSTTREVLARR